MAIIQDDSGLVYGRAELTDGMVDIDSGTESAGHVTIK